MSEADWSFIDIEYDTVTDNLETLTDAADAAGRRQAWDDHVKALNDCYWSQTLRLLDASSEDFKSLKKSVIAATDGIKSNLEGMKTFIAILGLLTAATKALTEGKKLADTISPPAPTSSMRAVAFAPVAGSPTVPARRSSESLILRELTRIRFQLGAKRGKAAPPAKRAKQSGKSAKRKASSRQGKPK